MDLTAITLQPNINSYNKKYKAVAKLAITFHCMSPLQRPYINLVMQLVFSSQCTLIKAGL